MYDFGDMTTVCGSRLLVGVSNFGRAMYASAPPSTSTEPFPSRMQYGRTRADSLRRSASSLAARSIALSRNALLWIACSTGRVNQYNGGQISPTTSAMEINSVHPCWSQPLVSDVHQFFINF